MNRENPSRKHPRWLIGLVALIAVVAGVRWFENRAQAAQPNAQRASAAVPITMAPVEQRDVDITLHALGTVTPVSAVTITSRVGGILQEVAFQEGQMVRKNDLLAVIDPRPYTAALDQAKGQLARDEAQLTNARLDLERYQSAARQHAIPEQQAATQEALVHAGEGTVQLDRASVEAAQVNLDYTRIVSPIDGRVGLRLVDAGNNIPANGTNGLATVTQLKPITVVFTLAQDYLPQVLSGMRSGTPLKVEAFARSGSTPIATGRLLTIDNQIDQATGTFRLKAVFANDDLVLWPGAFADLRFTVGVHRQATTVPTRAVQRGPDGSFVFVVKPDMTVELRQVDATPTDQGVMIISRGLQPGEKVVVDGQYRLEQGTRVAVQAPAANGRG